MTKPSLSFYVSVATADIVSFSFLSIVFISTILRLIFRRYVVPNMGSDDVYISFAVLFGLAYVIIMHFELFSYENLYDQLVQLPPAQQYPAISDYALKQFAIALNLAFWDNATQTISVTLAKMALVAFYRRLTVIKSHRVVLRVIDGILVGNCVSNCLVFIWTTSPIECSFHIDYYAGGEGCIWVIDTLAAVIASCAIQIVVDVCLCVLPWCLLWKMQMTTADKVKLFAIYSVGLTSLGASAARLWSVNTTSIIWVEMLRGQFVLTLTTYLEAFAAIVCANMPIIIGGFKRLQERRQRADRFYPYQASDSRTVGEEDSRMSSLKSAWAHDDDDASEEASRPRLRWYD